MVRLSTQIESGQPGYPWLVFLHGFSGDRREWQTAGAAFTDYPRLYIDLPGHGASATLRVSGFSEMSQLLNATLSYYQVENYWLIGYSLGARIAMYHACYFPAGLCGLVAEAGHPGLTRPVMRAERRINDQRWARRFCDEPLDRVFTDWYQQPVFASLDARQRTALITLRSHNEGNALGSMLKATSLAEQPDLREALAACQFPFHYLCGEHDDKFRALAKEIMASCHLIAHAGHNAHQENPAGVIAALAQILYLQY